MAIGSNVISALIAALVTALLCFTAISGRGRKLAESAAAVEKLRGELEQSAARLKDLDDSAHARDREWQEERARLDRERAELAEARHTAELARTRAETEAIAAVAAVTALTAERDEARLAGGQAQAATANLESDLAVARSQIAEAERSRDSAIAEKQAACEQVLAAERSAHVTAMAGATEAHRRSVEELRWAHEEVVSRERSHLAAREQEYERALALRDQEHERAITALREARDATESALREGFEQQTATLSARIAAQDEFLAKAEATLRETFGNESARALNLASERFFELAKKRFDERDESDSARDAQRVKELGELLDPVKQELSDLEELNRSIEKERAEAFGSLKETIQNLNRSNESLASALKKPSVRGSWGEGQLLTILESSGWVQGQNFDVQNVTEDDGKTLRTDVVVHLPRGRKVIIDSKAPLDQYLAAMEADDEEERNHRCREHARAVRGHVKALEKKEYWSRYDQSPPYVILFMPYEAAYQIACEHDRSLLDDAHRARIILANPMTLMNLVHLATYVLNEERLQQNAEEVRTHGKQLCERLGKVLELVGQHGSHVRLAAESYNKIVASMSGRLLPSANRMRELGAGSEKPLSVPDTVDTAIRHVIVPEMPVQAVISAPEQNGPASTAEDAGLTMQRY